MSADVEALGAELAQYKAFLKAEQDAGQRLMTRFCKAMGSWEGPWDNAVEARLKELVLLKKEHGG